MRQSPVATVLLLAALVAMVVASHRRQPVRDRERATRQLLRRHRLTVEELLAHVDADPPRARPVAPLVLTGLALFLLGLWCAAAGW